MAKLLLLGYGRMGQAVEQEALARQHEIMGQVDQHNQEHLAEALAAGPDAVIEFTHPESVIEHIKAVIPTGIPFVTGTTGWYDRLTEIEGFVQEHEGSMVFASNFSVGVNVLFKVNQYLAEIMDRYEAYDPYIEEQHHRHKKDAPSGTAITLSQQVLANLSRKTDIAYDQLANRPPHPEELSIGAIRAGEIIGKHTVAYHSAIDTLKLEHTAHNRRGFAQGAVIAAEWLVGKKGFYEFKDII